LFSESLTIDRFNQRLYALNDGSNTLSAFQINPQTGQLTQMPFSPIALPMSESYILWGTIAVHPSGSSLIVGGLKFQTSSSYGVIASYNITPTTAVAAENFYTVIPTSSVFSRNGKYFYTGGGENGSFGGYEVNRNSGAITALPGFPFAGENYGTSFATDLKGRLFLSNFPDSRAAAFTTSNGIPAQVAGSPFNSEINSTVDGVLSPDEKFYVLASRAGNLIRAFRIDGAGSETTLTAVEPKSSGGDTPAVLSFNQAGNLLFVANCNSRNISTFEFDKITGALNLINIQPPDTMGNPSKLVVGMDYFAVGKSILVSGKVLTPSSAVSKAKVYLQDIQGNIRTAQTNSFGNYRFDGVVSGQFYTVSVSSKDSRFEPKDISPIENLTDLNFVVQ
jgi:6-phosphogluconolactonase (cycloisomerase 2 family)